MCLHARHLYYLMWFPNKVNYGQMKRITCSVVDLNEALLEPLIQLMGTRVGVDTIYFHIEGLYRMMEACCPRTWT